MLPLNILETLLSVTAATALVPIRSHAYTHGGYVILEEGSCLDHIGWGIVDNETKCKEIAGRQATGWDDSANTLASWASSSKTDNQPTGCYGRSSDRTYYFNSKNSIKICTSEFPCICEKWGTEPLSAGEVYQPRNNFELKQAVMACINPNPPTGKRYCQNGWSRRQWNHDTSDFQYCTDSDKKAASNPYPLWEGDGSTCPAAFGSMETWDTSLITNTNRLFKEARSFNQKLDNWDVSSVTSAENMFTNARRFNANISRWDVSNMVSVKGMLSQTKALSYGGDILDNWILKKATKVSYMLQYSHESFDRQLCTPEWEFILTNATTVSTFVNVPAKIICCDPGSYLVTQTTSTVSTSFCQTCETGLFQDQDKYHQADSCQACPFGELVNMLLVLKLGPFVDEADDWLSFLTSFQMLMTLLGGLILKMQQGGTSSDAFDAESIGILLIVINGMGFLALGISLMALHPKVRACINKCGQPAEEGLNQKAASTKVTPVQPKKSSIKNWDSGDKEESKVDMSEWHKTASSTSLGHYRDGRISEHTAKRVAVAHIMCLDNRISEDDFLTLIDKWCKNGVITEEEADCLTEVYRIDEMGLK